MQRSFIGFVILLACLGCAGPSVSHWYMLDPGSPSVPASRSSTTNPTVLVPYVTIAPPFRSDKVLYRIAENQWEIDYNNGWMTPLSEMVTQHLRKWVHAPGNYKENSIIGKKNSKNILLQCKLLEFYSDLRIPQNPKAVITLQVEVFKGSPYSRKRVFIKEYSAAVAYELKQDNAYVQAENKALRRLLTEITYDLKKFNL